jgi:hypothetical protein
MKKARVLAYGIGGIIVGLLLENSVLRLREQGGQKWRAFKSKTRKKLHKG